MEFIPQFHDFNVYHYDQCRKNISVLEYYLDGETDLNLKNCYKQIMVSIIEQHRRLIEEYALVNSLHYDIIELNWIIDLENKIKQHE